MFFDTKKKNVGRSIIEHFDSKFSRERDEKPDWKEAPTSKMADGGEVDHMEALAAHSKEMHEAHEHGDHMRHAKALKAFMEEHETHKSKKEEE